MSRPRTFKAPRQLWPWLLAPVLAGVVALIWLEIAPSPDEHLLFALGIVTSCVAVVLLLDPVWVLIHKADRVEMDDTEVRTRTALGSWRALAWSEVERRSHFTLGRVGEFRLIGVDGRKLVFDTRLKHFDDLVELAIQRTPRAHNVEPSWLARRQLRRW